VSSIEATRDEITLGGRFPVVVKGYALTHAGRLAYCLTCEDAEEPA
jgi:hypothetical protein